MKVIPWSCFPTKVVWFWMESLKVHNMYIHTFYFFVLLHVHKSKSYHCIAVCKVFIFNIRQSSYISCSLSKMIKKHSCMRSRGRQISNQSCSPVELKKNNTRSSTSAYNTLLWFFYATDILIVMFFLERRIRILSCLSRTGTRLGYVMLQKHQSKYNNILGTHVNVYVYLSIFSRFYFFTIHLLLDRQRQRK